MKSRIVLFFERYYNFNTAIFCIFFIYFQTKMLHFLNPELMTFYINNYLNYLYAAALGIILIKEYKVFLKAKEFKIIILFLLWMLFVGLLNYWFSMAVVINVLFMSLISFMIPFLLTDQNKQRYTLIILIPTILFLTVLAVLGIYAFIINSDLRPLTSYMPHIDIHRDQSRLSVFWHVNLTAIIYNIVSIIVISFLFYLKKKYLKVVLVVILALFFIVMALTQSRTSNIGFAVAIGLIIASAVIKRDKLKGSSKKTLAFFLSFAATTLLVLLLSSVVLFIMNSIRISLSHKDFSNYPLVLQIPEQTNIETSETIVVETSDNLSTNEPIIENNDIVKEEDLEVGRSLSHWLDFNGRTGIWIDHLQIIKAHPSSFLFGYRLHPLDIQQELRNLTERETHPHSGYLHALLSLGIVGLLLYVMFYATIILRIFNIIIKGSAFTNNIIFYGSIVIYFMIAELMEVYVISVNSTWSMNEFFAVFLMYCSGMVCSQSEAFQLFGRNAKKLCKKQPTI